MMFANLVTRKTRNMIIGTIRYYLGIAPHQTFKSWCMPFMAGMIVTVLIICMLDYFQLNWAVPIVFTTILIWLRF